MWGQICTEASYQTNFNFSFPTYKSDILIHLSQWQYWWWFWFSFFWTFYYFLILRLVKHRTLKMNPKINTSLRSKGKWGDFVIALVPLSWCGNILTNSNFILRMIEWHNETSLFTVRVHGKQWYWVYKFDAKDAVDIFTAPKNVGKNRWVVSAPNELKISDSYLEAIQTKANTVWIKDYWKEIFKKELADYNATTLVKTNFLKKPIKKKQSVTMFSKLAKLDPDAVEAQNKKAAEAVKTIRDIVKKKKKSVSNRELFLVYKQEAEASRTAVKNLLNKYKKSNNAIAEKFTPSSLFASNARSLLSLSKNKTVNSAHLMLSEIKSTPSTKVSQRAAYAQFTIQQLAKYYLKALFPTQPLNLKLTPLDPTLDFFSHLWGTLKQTKLVPSRKVRTLSAPVEFSPLELNKPSSENFEFFDKQGALKFENRSAALSQHYDYTDMDNEWDIEHNIKKKNYNKPLRLLKLNTASNSVIGKLFKFKFLDDNDTLEEKQYHNSDFLILKQKRYKKKQKISNTERFDINPETGEKFKKEKKNVKFYSRRVLFDNKIFNDSALSNDMDSYSLYKIVRNNKKRSELLPVTLCRRLLRTKKTLVLPAHVNLTVVTNSYDVVHSWFLPGLGIKLDCVPGRSTHHSLYLDNVGFYYGQCAEICGRYHHHMPIRVCALPFEHFLVWWNTKGLPKLLRLNKKKKAVNTLIKNKYAW